MLEQQYVDDVLRLGGRIVSAQEFIDIYRACDKYESAFHVIVDSYTIDLLREECGRNGLVIPDPNLLSKHYPIDIILKDSKYYAWDMASEKDRDSIDFDDWEDYGGETVIENGLNYYNQEESSYKWHLFAIGNQPSLVNVEELI